MSNINIDWESVEQKISVICYKFSNLSAYHEDLAQELRIHAYYVSDSYYDLYRKAIDYWRKVQTKQKPEVPYFDLEVLTGSKKDTDNIQFEKIIELVRKELNRPAHNKWDENSIELSKRLLNIILEDIDPEKVEHKEVMRKSKLNHYVNKRLNLSWVSEETGVGYKRLIASMKLLEDLIRGLASMHKIEIPDEYFKGYYDEK